MQRNSSPWRAALLAAAGLAVAVAAAAVACGPRPPDVAGLPERVDYNFHVRPILSDRCFKCHGPDDRARKAGLRLDTEAGPFLKLASGRRAVVPGSTWRSELVRRILSDDPDVMMPAPDSHLSLNDYEKALLVRWVEQDAPWAPHWAFQPPQKPEVPAVDDARPDRTEVDAFIVARLAGLGLTPSPEADRETLIRRVTLDLTGLPPSIADIDAFLADTAPGAYERVVDRLLASPAYGERVAVEWLDVARFADSHGYQDDGMRDMSPWRTWVIDAFNRNLRFDEFATWQLAGDLLPSPTEEQLLATGFNRHHMQSQEGGVVPEEYRVEYVADRVNTFGKAFLGLSVECARCHDHKYDPVLQTEYYRLFAFFNSVNETGQIPYSGVPSPTVILQDDAARKALAALRAEIEPLASRLDVNATAFDAGFDAWQGRASATAPLPAPDALVAHLPLDGIESRTVTGNDRKSRTVTAFTDAARRGKFATLGGDRDRVPVPVEGHAGTGLRLAGDSFIDLGKDVAFFERNQPFTFSIWFRIEQEGAAGPLVTRTGGIFNGNRGFELMLQADGRFTTSLNHVFPANGIEIASLDPVSPKEWHHAVVTYDGSSRAAGLRLFLDGRPAATRIVVDHLLRSVLHNGNGNWGDMPGVRLGRRHDETLEDVSVDEFRVYARQLSGLEVAALGGAPDPLGGILAVPVESRTPAQRAALREHYVLHVAPGLDGPRRRLAALRQQENDILSALPEVMTMGDLPEPRETFVLERGAYDAPTVRVEPGTPASILAFEGRPPTRLGLARWLFDPKHPLTARVVANRYWGMVFGTGLVATPEDFGSQGRLPTHPDLLDWLAVTLVESGWDLKALHKRLVMSATYRQSSVADARRREIDGANAWLSRGPSHRLAFEQIRDSALAASGLLVRRLGGPSVYPYQPPGLWEELATRNATTYTQGTGDDLHRRSLYTVWKRSTPPPSAMSFDAAERLTCAVRRQRTATPLQALVLLNDPQYVEAARALAERVLREAGPEAGERIALAFRLVTSRTPRPEELAALSRLRDAEAERFARDRAAALALLGTGQAPRDTRLDAAEAAAYTVVANTILNLDEAVTKR